MIIIICINYTRNMLAVHSGILIPVSRYNTVSLVKKVMLLVLQEKCMNCGRLPSPPGLLCRKKLKSTTCDIIFVCNYICALQNVHVFNNLTWHRFSLCRLYSYPFYTMENGLF